MTYFINKTKLIDKYEQLFRLYGEGYEIVRGHMSLESEDMFYYIALKHDIKHMKGKDLYKISPLTIHIDNEDRLPLFCQILSGGEWGELVTCYKEEVR